MPVSRWKVMAGGLLLSAGGLMAVADGPTPLPPLTLPGCQPMAPPAAYSPPVAVPAPRVAELPPPPTATLPPVPAPAVTAPSPEVAPAPRPLRAIGFKDNGTTVYDKLPPPTATTVLTQPATRQFVTKRMLLTPDGKTVELDDAGKPARPDNPLLPPPGVSVPFAAAEVKADAPKPDLNVPIRFTPEGGFGQPPADAPAVPAAARPEPFVNQISGGKPEPTAEKRLKVVLHMGDDRPRFEVKDGDEVYLKVVSDRVEVKSAADKGDVATMKAAGRVGFVTPGGDGTCDELAILPGSGQVVAVGGVSFRHTWGRSETTVTAERMTFRLAHPGPTAIQAGYTSVR